MSGRLNLFILVLCQIICTAVVAIAVTTSGLAGKNLAPDASLATLPWALGSVGTALTTAPISLLMGRYGRRIGFWVGAGGGIIGGGLAAYAIFNGNFALFCVGVFIFGSFQAASQYYRFAAADSVEPAFKSQAISWVMAGGVVAALFGPHVGAWGRAVIGEAEFAGSYLAMVAFAVALTAIVGSLRLPKFTVTRRASSLPLATLIGRPIFIVAVANGVVGYGVMAFLMTATPLAVVGHNHTVNDAAGIIQAHLLGMFAPSFVTGSLIARFGVSRVMLAGNALLFASVVVGLSGVSVPHFWVALLLVGVGWNFCYIGATTLLSTEYTADERPRVQALSESLTFGATAIASVASGGVFAWIGWLGVNQTALPLLMAATIVSVWYATLPRLTARVPNAE